MKKDLKNDWTVTIEGISAEDMKRFAEKAGACGISAGELLGNFINDLVGGATSNGEDERDLAQQWFNRCWFGMFPECTFLRYLVENNSPYAVLDPWGEIQQSKEIIRQSEENLANENYEWYELKTSKGTPFYSSREAWESQEREDIEGQREYIASCQKILSDCWEDYISYGTGSYQHGTFNEEMQNVLEWAQKNCEFLSCKEQILG